jgi:adenine phosphoribosyltransferase
MEDLKAWIRSVPDFPIPGILFYDITTLLKRPEGLAAVIEALIEQYRDEQVDIVAGIESRGFMFGTPLALELNAGFVPIRKPGKLPAETIHREYELEYGNNRLEIHRDAIQPGQRVLVIDDLLATGGTAKASIELIEELGGTVVGATLKGCEVFSLLTYYE